MSVALNCLACEYLAGVVTSFFQDSTQFAPAIGTATMTACVIEIGVPQVGHVSSQDVGQCCVWTRHDFAFRLLDLLALSVPRDTCS
jgi:hypothetical protein